LCTLEREEIAHIARFSMSNSRIQKESLDPMVSVSVSDRKYPIGMYIHCGSLVSAAILGSHLRWV
jgi:hypothetical protein